MCKAVSSWIVLICGFCTVGCGGGGATMAMAGGATTATSATANGGGATPVAAVPGGTTTAGAGNGEGTSASSSGTGVEPQWNIEATGTTDALAAVWGIGHSSAWAVGTHSILRSAGDGSWTIVRSGDSDQYAAVFGADGVILVAGLACDSGLCDGGVLLRSTDDGATWTRTALTDAAYNFARGADGTIYLATDGGVLASSDDFATSTLQAVSSLPAMHGVFVGGDAALLALGGVRSFEIRRSGDGGTSWATSFSGVGGSQSGYVGAAWSAGDANVYAVANASDVPRTFGRLLRSSDGGESFAPTSIPDLDDANAVWGSSATDVYVAGSQLLHAGDGSTFTPVTLPAMVDWHAMWGSDAANIFLVGEAGTILHLH